MNEEIRLFFSEEEMKEFLSRKGYTIASIDTWENHNVYHNQVETDEFKRDIAFKGQKPDDLHNSWRSLDSKYGIRAQFRKELLSSLLNL